MKVGNFLLSVLHFVYTQNDIDNFGDEVFINQDGYPIGIRLQKIKKLTREEKK